MSRYLDKFVSVIPAVQGKQITEILSNNKNLGSIRTVEEYSQKADELFQVLAQTDPKPTLKLFLGEVDKTLSSETFNFMMERIIDDLTSVFKEAKNIADVAILHRKLIVETILRSLRFAINNLNDNISVHEFLSKNKDGFTAAQFNSFKQDNVLKTARTDALATALYVDPSTGLLVPATEDAVVDPVGEQLLLSASLTKEILMKNVRLILDADTRATEVDVTFPGSDIKHIIDGQEDTYWINDVLLSSPEPEGVIMKLELQLAGMQEVNFIELEPATLFQFSLFEMDYIDASGSLRHIPLDEVVLDRPRRLNFSKITTNTIILSFRQRTYIRARYSFNADTQSYERIVAQDPITLEDVDFTSVEQELSDLIDSANLKAAIGVTQAGFQFDDVDMFEYIAGFDNIRVGLNQYNERGIYVGSKLESPRPGVLGLQVNAQRNLHEVLGYPIDSLEFTVYKQNFDSSGNFVDTEVFNVPPVSETSMSHERMLLSDRTALPNDTGVLRFYPDVTKPFKIFRDGTELTIGSDYQVSGDSGVSYQSVLNPILHNPGGQFHDFKVQIIGPASTSIYTASYTPLYNVYVNSGRTATLVNGNLINFVLERTTNSVDRSEMYLIITLRRNFTDVTRTPELRDYSFLVGSVDKEKFTGDELT